MTAKPPTATQVRRLVFSLRDFNHANSALVFLSEEYDPDTSYSRLEWRKFSFFESTAIVAFCRPLVASRGATTLNLGLAKIRFDNEESSLRDRLLYIRNSIVAHSDEAEMHYRLTVIRPFEEMARLAMPIVEFVDGLILSPQDRGSFHDLTRRIQHQLAQSIFDLSQSHPELIEAYVKPMA